MEAQSVDRKRITKITIVIYRWENYVQSKYLPTDRRTI